MLLLLGGVVPPKGKRERESQPLIVLGRERFEGAIEREKLVSWWKDAAAGKSENPVSCADDDCG